MKKVEVEIKLNINFYNSFFFGGGTGSGEIQSYLLRDIRGLPYISGAALKGCISEYAFALSQIVPEFNNGERIFGTSGVKQGCLYFEDGKLIKSEGYYGLQESLMELRTGVSISNYTKAKKDGHLYTMELSGLGGYMVFESNITGFLDENTYQKDIAHLVASIRLIYALGGRRSAGLGWLKEPAVCEVHKITGDGRRELVKLTDVNKWIKDWIGGK
ncbi:MAG: hypothetical protein HFH67_00650 [Lachnospiraceae bacterium]|nr:hypothetical protein [Lachnospiraceae bacterium]